MFTFEELYDILILKNGNERETKKAKHDLAFMSDMDWNDWIEYRNSRKANEGERT